MRQQDCTGLEALCLPGRSAFRGVAFSYAGRNISRRALFREKEDCARALVRWGVSAGDPVLLCAASSPEAIAVLLALWKLGAVPHLLNQDRPSQEMEKTACRSGARLLLVTDQFLPRLAPILKASALLQVVVIPLGKSMPRSVRRCLHQPQLSECEVLPWKDFLASGHRIPIAPGAARSGEDVAAVIWQGPDYGEACRISQGTLATLMGEWKRAMEPRSRAVFGMLPPWSLPGLASLLAGLDVGVTVILEPDTRPEALAGTLLREQPPWAIVTPALWHELWNRPEIAGANLTFLEKLWIAVPEREGPSGEEVPRDVFFPCSVEIIIV